MAYQSKLAYEAGEEESDRRQPIYEFDVHGMKPDRIILIVGMRGVGKSTVMEDILHRVYLNYDAGCAMSPTPASLEMFRAFLPDTCVHDEFDAAKVEEFVELAQALANEGIHRKLFLFLDDCMFDKKIMNTRAMRLLHMNGRHLHMQFVNIVQYVMNYPKDLRSMVDYVFALREPMVDNRFSLYKNFFNVFPSFDDFEAAMAEFTTNFGCLVCDRTATSGKLEDSVFWYKAKVHPPGRLMLGNRDYWKLHFLLRKEDKRFALNRAPILALAPAKPDGQQDPRDGDRDHGRRAARPPAATARRAGLPRGTRKAAAAPPIYEKRDVDGKVVVDIPAAAPAPVEQQQQQQQQQQQRQQQGHDHSQRRPSASVRRSERDDGARARGRGPAASGHRHPDRPSERATPARGVSRPAVPTISIHTDRPAHGISLRA